MIVGQTRQKNVIICSNISTDYSKTPLTDAAHKISARCLARGIQLGRCCVLQYEYRGAFDRDTGESSRSPRAGIDIDPVGANVGVIHGRMTVHDKLAMILR